MEKYENLLAKTRTNLAKKSNHIPSKDLMTHYVLPLLNALNEDFEEALAEVYQNIDGGADAEDVEVLRDTIVALASFAEKYLVEAGYIVSEVVDGVPQVKMTDKAPKDLEAEFAGVSSLVQESLTVLAEMATDEDDEDDEDDEGDDEESSDELEESDDKSEALKVAG